MVSVLSKYKALFIAFALVALAAFIWLFISWQSGSKVPSKGVFVLGRTEGIVDVYDGSFIEGGCFDAECHV